MIRVPGLDRPVVVTRDADGIPRIRTETPTDAYFALGFVHAQDRLWQMEATRRVALGRLSEIVGAVGLPSDRFARVMGFDLLAKAALAGLSPAARAAVDAYTAGVNAWIKTHSGALPPEFVALRFAPEPWRPEDCMLWGRLMATRLSNWAVELSRLRLGTILRPEDIDDLFPAYPADGPLTIDDALGKRADAGSGAARVSAHLAVPLPISPGDPALPSEASNAFVVAGDRTKSGKPLLANDPHLGFDAPNLWYLARIDAPGLTLAGATVPGVPFLIIGHNEHVGWGFTTTGAETDALFAERVAPNGTSVDGPSGPEKLATRNETILVKGSDPVHFLVRQSRHGPIVSDILPIPGLGPGQIAALDSPTLRADDRTAEAFYRMNTAANARDFLEALHDFGSPMQNAMFADRNGTIGFVTAGRIPIRAAPGSDTTLLPGWTDAYDTKGFVPFAALPQVINPPRGTIVNANDRVVDVHYPYNLGGFWAGPERAMRIDERLAGQDHLDAAGVASIQTDDVSLGARNLLPRLLPLLANAGLDPVSASARARLASWDGAMDRSRPEPLIYHAWIDALARSLAAGRNISKEPISIAILQRPLVLTRVLDAPQRWCPSATSAELDNPCQPIVAGAFATAMDDLAKAFGNDVATWRWGDAHRAVFVHRLFAPFPLLDRLTTIDVATDGDDDTVDRGTVGVGPRARGSWFYTPPLYPNIHGPGFRTVLDLADPDRSLFMQATGQSGNPLSSHYRDLSARWADGKYVSLPPAPPAGKAEPGTQSLILLPQPVAP